MEMEKKKVEDADWNTEGAVEGRCEEHRKGNAELEQISDLCSNALCHLSKAVTICIPVCEAGGRGASPQMAVWPWCSQLLHNPAEEHSTHRAPAHTPECGPLPWPL